MPLAAPAYCERRSGPGQAKGRVEREHHTLQDRLVKELRLAGISTIEAANAFLPNFVANYNGRFAKPAARDQDFHRSVDPRQDLDQILCWREQRQVSHQLVVNYSRVKLTSGVLCLWCTDP